MVKLPRSVLPFGPAYDSHPIVARKSKTCEAIWSIRGRHREGLHCSYFIDEAGDPVLFGPRGRVLVGRDGCSRYFVLGMTWVLDPAELTSDMVALRKDLLADRYLSRIPSMSLAARKTAVFFHAKDDVAEVRREVFRLLMRHPLQFFAVVRDKESLVGRVRARQQLEPGYLYREDHVYDELVTTVARDRLHRDASYSVVFARRGASDRTAALSHAIERARQNFADRWGVTSEAPISIEPRHAHEAAGLQATDYLLWALQRCYEKQEDRYLDYVWPCVRLVHDLDDIKERPYGQFYGQDRRLTAELVQSRRRRI